MTAVEKTLGTLAGAVTVLVDQGWTRDQIVAQVEAAAEERLADLLADLERDVRAQWEKYNLAKTAGVTGAPLVRIDQKIRRLENELDEIRDRERLW